MSSFETKINNITSKNENNKEVIKDNPELLQSYEKYNTMITKLQLSNFKSTIDKTNTISKGLEKFIDGKLKETDDYIDQKIESGDLSGLNSIIVLSTNFIETKIKSFENLARLSKKNNEKKAAEAEKEKEELSYNSKKSELTSLLDNDLNNKLKHLESLFKDEGKFEYYNTQFKLEDALGEGFKDIDKQYDELANISILGMQNIFLNQGIALSEVNTKILKLIENSSYNTKDKIKQIKKAINEVGEFEKNIDDFIEKTKQIEDLDETEIDDKLLKTVIKGTGSVLSEAAKFFVAPIGFWAGITENASGDTSTGVQDSAEFAASFVPILGNGVDFAQWWNEETFSGRKLSKTESWISLGTGVIGIALDLTGVGYFLRSGGKLAVKGGTTIAKGAIRGSDDLLKATVKDSGIFVGNFNKMLGNFKANFGALTDAIAKKKVSTLAKEFGAYAKDDMKNIVGVNMVKGIRKGMKTGFIRTVNFAGEKDSFSWVGLEKQESWKGWESFGHSENLSKLEKTDIIKEAGITVDKDGKITDSELEISDKIDALFNGNKITRDQILEKINAHEGTDEEKVKAFMMEIGITDKSIIGQVKNNNYDKNTLANLIFNKQTKQLNDPNFTKFKENIKRNLYKNEQYFDSNYLAPQRNLSEVDLKMSNKEDNFALFGKDTNGEKLSPNWYKTEEIPNPPTLTTRYNNIYSTKPNINLDNLNLGTSNTTENIYKYIKDNKISNVDDLANQLKRDNKLQLDYTNNNDFRITRQTAEQAWDNAFTTKIKSLDDEISTLKKDIKNLEKESKKLDDDFKVNTTNRKKIIKDGTILKNLETNPETEILFNSLDTLGDYKNLKTDLNDILTLKNEAIITTEKQIVDLKNILLSKDRPSDTLTNNIQTQITSLNNELAQLKTSQNNIKTAIKQFERNINSFEKTQKKTAKIQTEKKKLEAKKEKKDEIEKSLADTKERTPLFKEVTELDIDKVKSGVIDNYIKNSSNYISKGDKLEDIIDKVKNNSGETDTDIVNNTALYIWKLSNPDIGDSLKLFIEKMNIKDHNTIFNKLTNEKGRAKFSDLLETLETELKNTENKFGKEYLTKLKEYNNLHFLGKNSNTFKELFNYKKAIDNGEDPKEYLRRNPNLKKIMEIPELSKYIKNPTKLEQLFGALGKYSMKAKIAKKVVEKVAPSVKKGTEKAKEAFKNATEDYGK